MMRSAVDNRIFIGLGSNLGDPFQNLIQAARRLKERLQTELVVSPVYRSEPVGIREQPWFYNQVIYCAPDLQLGPGSLLKMLKEIEKEMGRTPIVRYGPRLIDLDLLFYRNWVFESSELIVPHPRIYERSFVLLPLLDLDPELVEPRSRLAIKEIWERNRGRLGKCFIVK